MRSCIWGKDLIVYRRTCLWKLPFQIGLPGVCHCPSTGSEISTVETPSGGGQNLSAFVLNRLANLCPSDLGEEVCVQPLSLGLFAQVNVLRGSTAPGLFSQLVTLPLLFANLFTYVEALIIFFI